MQFSFKRKNQKSGQFEAIYFKLIIKPAHLDLTETNWRVFCQLKQLIVCCSDVLFANICSILTLVSGYNLIENNKEWLIGDICFTAQH